MSLSPVGSPGPFYKTVDGQQQTGSSIIDKQKTLDQAAQEGISGNQRQLKKLGDRIESFAHQNHTGLLNPDSVLRRGQKVDVSA